MNTVTKIKTNRFWQECQRFAFAQMTNEHEDRIQPPQAGGLEA